MLWRIEDDKDVIRGIFAGIVRTGPRAGTKSVPHGLDPTNCVTNAGLKASGAIADDEAWT